MYADPSSVDLSNPINLIYYINNNSYQLFGIGFVIVIWILVFIGYYKGREDFTGAFAVSSFIAFLLGLLGWAGGIVPPYFFSIVTGITIISGILLYMDRGNS